ncbi:hypothetical protein AB0M54_25615 [Actinoplanes sp. NPDC051470]|uniref:hypothetical protein n=1 Tax=unclassified Actinoplanes TaxID=2626549 RepID=UPI003420693C
MDTSTWTLVIGGAIGLALAVFGVKVLVTGRAPASTSRAFRNVREAGLYHLLFGVALILLVAGTRLPGERTGIVTAVLAVVLAMWAILKYRPKKRKEVDEPR